MLKHVKLRRALSEALGDLDPGDALPPIRTLMRRYGVSLATVNRALSELESEGRVVRRRGSGVYPVAPGRSSDDSVGIVVPGLESPYYQRILIGAARGVVEFGRSLTVYQDLRGDCRELAARGVPRDLLIVPRARDAYDVEFIGLIQKLLLVGIRLMVLENPVPGVNAAFAGMDNRGAFAKLAEMIRTDRRKDVLIYAKTESLSGAERTQGVLSVFDQSSVNYSVVNVKPDSNPNDLKRVGLEKSWDAVVICDPNVCVSLATTIHDESRGWDRKPLIAGIVEEGDRFPFPGGVTLEKPSFQLGTTAVRRLLSERKTRDGAPTVTYLPIAVIGPGSD